MATQHKVTILYTAVDGSRMIKDFKTLNGAKGFAHKMIGEHPEMGGHYAVSGDGIGKVQVTGVSLNELFPEKTPARVEPEMNNQNTVKEHWLACVTERLTVVIPAGHAEFVRRIADADYCAGVTVNEAVFNIERSISYYHATKPQHARDCAYVTESGPAPCTCR